MIRRFTIRLRAGSRDRLQYLISQDRPDGKASTASKTLNEVFGRLMVRSRKEGTDLMEEEIILLRESGWPGGEGHVAQSLKTTQRMNFAMRDSVRVFLESLRSAIQDRGITVSTNEVVNGLISFESNDDAAYLLEVAISRVAALGGSAVTT